MDAAAEASRGEGAHHGGEQRKDDLPPEKKVPLLGMLRYADRLDILLMVIGSLGAVGNGASGSLILVFFGDAINSFGESTTSTVLPAVTKVVLNFVYVGIGTAVASFLRKWNSHSILGMHVSSGPASDLAAAVGRAAIFTGEFLLELMQG